MAAKETRAWARRYLQRLALPACDYRWRIFVKKDVCSAHLLGGTIFAVDEEGKFREPR